MEGNFEQGFPAILRMRNDDARRETEIQVVGKLPPAPILEPLINWQLAYRQMVMPHSRITPKPAQVTNFSCRQLGDDLAAKMNSWLNSGFRDWQKIRDQLQQNLGKNDEIHVIIETNDLRLRQMPWHLWDLFSHHYTQAEIAFSALEYQPPKDRTTPVTNQVRILAILGNSQGIDVQKDRAMLEQLPHTETTFLVEPQRHELNNQLWEQQWDILFFAGHSSSQVDGDTGRIYINQTDSLSISELNNALRRAIESGLQLAIFNSCDGLGLARELADLHIPQVIIMKEPVPDLVAQEFLKHFLSSFAAGKSLYLAVREAREKLQVWEKEFPFASWLPVICQNQAAVLLTWNALYQPPARPKQLIMKWNYKVFLLLVIPLIFAWLLNILWMTLLNHLFSGTPSPLCYGNSCIGRDPLDNKCNNDAKTITSIVGNSLPTGDKSSIFKLELRHSARCSSSWAKITGSAISGSNHYIENRQGKKYGEAKVANGATRYYNDMGPGNIEVRACAQPPKVEPVCTNFVKP
jgi:hypothetical protein